jgi:hypothetical protein
MIFEMQDRLFIAEIPDSPMVRRVGLPGFGPSAKSTDRTERGSRQPITLLAFPIIVLILEAGSTRAGSKFHWFESSRRLIQNAPKLLHALSGFRRKREDSVDLQRLFCEQLRRAAPILWNAVDLSGHDGKWDSQFKQPIDHHLVLFGRSMPAVDNDHHESQLLSTRQKLLYHRPPSGSNPFRRTGVPVTGQVDKHETTLDLKKINQLSPPRRRTDPRKIFPAD